MKATQTKPWLKYADPELITRIMPQKTVLDYFLWRNEGRMDHPALNYYDRIFTLQDIYDNACKAANAYAARGVKKGDFVIVVAPTTPEIVYTFYGLCLLGAVPNMIDPRYSADGIRDFIKEVDAKFVLAVDVMYDKVIEAVKGTNVKDVVMLSPAESLPKLLHFGYLLKNPMKKNMPEGFIYWGDFIEQGKDCKVEYLHGHHDSCCIIVHTGGTTGRAKSVMLSHDNINAVSFQYHKSLMHNIHGSSDKFLDIMPPFVAYGFGYGIHLPVCSDQISVLIPSFDPKDFGKLILKHRPQNIAGTPSYFLVLINDKRMKKADLSCFKNACAGGDSISLENEKRVSDWLMAHGAKYPLTKGYGMTELSAVSTACFLDVNRPGSVGIPHADFLIAAFDPETGEELEMGQQGEICITGPTVMMGYYNQPEETANILRKHADGLTWVHTGDLGYMDEDGFVYIMGRLKRMFPDTTGYKIFPSVIEEGITKCADISECTVVGVDAIGEVQGKTPYAFFTLVEGCTKSAEQVAAEAKAICEENVVSYMWPKYYACIDKMPLTPIGKVDFKELERRADKAVKG